MDQTCSKSSLSYIVAGGIVNTAPVLASLHRESRADVDSWPECTLKVHDAGVGHSSSLA